MTEVFGIKGEDVNCFYELAGKSRKDKVWPDLKPYIREKSIARTALRKARDLDIPDSAWQTFIDNMDDNNTT